VANPIYLSLILAVGLWSLPKPVSAQAFIPYTPQLDSAELEQTGVSLAQEAAQLEQFQQYDLALSRAQLATQLAPKKYQAWILLGVLYMRVQKLDQGITALQQAQSLAPDNPEIKFFLGEVHFRQAQYDKAIEQIQAGLKIKPNTPGALFDLGNAFYKLGKLQDAIAQYEKSVAQYQKVKGQEKDRWPAINNIGLVKYEMGDADGAISQWREAVAIEQKAAEPMMALAIALYTKGDREQGLTMAEASLRIDKRYGDINFLKENLWGDRLIAEAQKLLATPRIQATLAKLQDEPMPIVP
jgi:tetratricopeptide (TPR) repeat protein